MNRNRTMTIVTALGVLVMSSGPAAAFWDESMGHKMHFPQFPDPDGWDVNMSLQGSQLGDDWQCSESGPVADIHFWASWHQDVMGDILGIRAAIYSNIPETADAPSQPGDLLWTAAFTPADFSIHPGGDGDQGWFDPEPGVSVRPDHTKYVQVNIPKIKDPFIQTEGEVYWLVLQANVEGGQIGWKTSQDHFMDDAAYRVPGVSWKELIDPETGQSLDLAFVITPEPGTLTFLALGGVGVLYRRRRMRK